eukprot:tig00000383_g24633.t1
MSASPAPVKAVADCVFDLLHNEIVDWASQTAGPSTDAVVQKLDRLGFQVGYRLAERYSREKPRFADTLEIIKFLCKEFWTEAFKRQVDNLKTNHRGVFVLLDKKFRLMANFSPPPSASAKDLASIQLAFTCGMIRGALHDLSVAATVTAEFATPAPAQDAPFPCNFTIRTKAPPPPPPV